MAASRPRTAPRPRKAARRAGPKREPVEAPGRTVAAELPVRALLLLRGIATHSGIRGEMGRAGYRRSDDEEGWQLLRAACAWEDAGTDPAEDAEPRAATRAIAEFVQRRLPPLLAAMERLHPEATPLFEGLIGPQGVDPVFAMMTWLGRLSKLAPATRKTVLATLARRGVDASELARLQRLLSVSQGFKQPTSVGPLRPDRSAELTALHQWYRDWSTTARAVIDRKDWQATLGVAGWKQRRGKKSLADG